MIGDFPHVSGDGRSMNWMERFETMSERGPSLKYPWQQSVVDAFMETRPQLLPAKINAAERAIAARLHDAASPDLNERIALQDALRSLQVLFKELERQRPPGKKSDIA
jgi:hypothetical protein